MSTCTNNSLGRAIYQTSQALRNHIDQTLKPHDITMEQLHILKHIERDPGRAQREICEMAGKSAANITRILDRLEKKKLILRRGNPKDRRSQLVSLTETGENLASEMVEMFTQLSQRIENQLDTDDIEVVQRVLGRIQMNLLELSENPGDHNGK